MTSISENVYIDKLDEYNNSEYNYSKWIQQHIS